MELAPNQVGLFSVVGGLYYGFNPISLDESRTTLLEKALVKMILYLQGQTMA